MVAKCFNTTTVDTTSRVDTETKISIQENNYTKIHKGENKMQQTIKSVLKRRLINMSGSGLTTIKPGVVIDKQQSLQRSPTKSSTKLSGGSPSRLPRQIAQQHKKNISMDASPARSQKSPLTKRSTTISPKKQIAQQRTKSAFKRFLHFRKMQDKEVFKEHFMKFIPQQVKMKLNLNVLQVPTPKRLVEEIIHHQEKEVKVKDEKPDRFKRKIHYAHMDQF